MKDSLIVGIIQEGPVYLNLEASLEKARQLIKEAVDKGAELVVFGETWLSGYPGWLDHCPNVALWDHEPTKAVFARMYENSIEVPGRETAELGQLAAQYGIYIGIGVNEVIRKGPGQGTIYNTFLLFSAEGQLLVHHPKLMPTYTEKLLYGLGDGSGLHAADSPYGRIGGLICWEHWMPLARQAMHESGEHIHIALWPNVHEMLQLASRSYAFEGRCFVIAAGQLMYARDIPEEIERPSHLAENPDTLILKGGSCIIGPDGKYLLEPCFGEESLIIHEIKDLGHSLRERMSLDISGHYNRRDVFDFKVKKVM